jgi:NAD(P)-dependent dehydrogenase (short-subunit alcohol dehydrogenase family)
VKEGGYPATSYGVSKTAEIALSMVQARDRELNSKGITVNAVSRNFLIIPKLLSVFF